ncbi:myb domain-containing protein [Heterostelium album PN500]|uniref:Myb domain-containing protein n=1 Tax=Heterostelium pallidum (strain ATCC 26659 / Pp 5 / PN500) TaxID=670386 RepID=D3BM79_HETP5|nr:myb domain-containing protein [Heterostelium album PN500]EFA77680.1 myb domain-containing protein [Heterostelium album PN500]|eukprot:XP_020429808.1 myb domain-containing protein [Heterostelium album PN500]
MSFNQMVPNQPLNPTQLLQQQAMNPKSRKPYTITKQRENWTEEEHAKFLEALTLFGRDWKKIEGFVGTKTVIQIRSHAQKYFIKVTKNNTGENIPPPRPKRKSVQPYPQKARNDPSLGMLTDSLSNNPFLNSASFVNWMSYRGLMPSMDNSSGGAMPLNSMDSHRQQLEQLNQAQQYIQSAMSAAQNANRNAGSTANSMSSSSGNINITPNYPKIYNFLSALFDSNNSSYTDTLNELSQIDRETMQLLMHNLAINLANQQYRDQHQSLLDQCRSMKREDEEEIISSPIISPRNPGSASDFCDTLDSLGFNMQSANNIFSLQSTQPTNFNLNPLSHSTPNLNMNSLMSLNTNNNLLLGQQNKFMNTAQPSFS